MATQIWRRLMDCNSLYVKSILSPSFFKDIDELSERNIDFEQLNNSSVLITGAAGLIGKYLTLCLLNRNDKYHQNIHIIALVHTIKKATSVFGKLIERSDITFIESDICQLPNSLPAADFIIHAASPASLLQYKTNPVGTITANTVGTYQILEYAKNINCKSILCCSSLKVYGTYDTYFDKIQEDNLGKLDFTNYLNCYAEGKRALETTCASYIKQYNLPIKIVRPSYIYGPCPIDDDRVWAQFIANIIRKEKILLKSNGLTHRSFCYVLDTAAAFLSVLLSGKNGEIYNISDDSSNVTIRSFAEIAVQVFPERNLSISFENPEDKEIPADYKKSTPEILDSEKIHSIGWEALVSIADGIHKIVSIMENGYLQ